MTDDADISSDPYPKWDEATDPDGYVREDLEPKDVFLDSLLDFIVGFDEEHDGSMGMVVISNGAVVSGLVISRRAFIDANTEMLASNSDGDFAPSVKKVWDFSASLVAEIRDRRDAAKLPTRPHTFLHMKNARIHTGSSHVDVPFWRGTMQDITGWSMGSHNPPGSR